MKSSEASEGCEGVWMLFQLCSGTPVTVTDESKQTIQGKASQPDVTHTLMETLRNAQFMNKIHEVRLIVRDGEFSLQREN